MIRVWTCPSLSRLTVVCAALALCAGAATAGEGLGKSRPRADRCVAMYGPGFVAVEGTEACIRIGGHIRVESGVSRHSRGGAAPAWTSGGSSLGRGVSTSAAGELDARAETGIGTVRGVLRLRGGHASMPDPFR
jgi:hypothetical protein